MGMSIGKGCDRGGSLSCFEVMGHGIRHPVQETSVMCKESPEGKIARTLGLGNAVQHVRQKVMQSGVKAAMSLDLLGHTYDFEGTDVVKSDHATEPKNTPCGCTKEHVDCHFLVIHHFGQCLRGAKRDTVTLRVMQNESNGDEVQVSADNGRTRAVEGVNTFLMFDVTCTPQQYKSSHVLGKVVNVGGAVMLGSETMQNLTCTMRLFEEADVKSCLTTQNTYLARAQHGIQVDGHTNHANGVNTGGPTKAVNVTSVQGRARLVACT